MAESVTPQKRSTAKGRLTAAFWSEMDDDDTNTADAILSVLPLVLEAAMEAGRVVECTDPEGVVTWKIR